MAIPGQSVLSEEILARGAARAAAGEVFAAGHAESAHDLPLLLSTTKAGGQQLDDRSRRIKHFPHLP